MKAVVCDSAEKLVVKDIPIPELDPEQVLVQVGHAGFCGSDHTIIENQLMPDGYILGHEISGTVVKVGPECKGAAIGERVTIRPTECGHCFECLAGRPALCQTGRRTIGTGDLPGGFAEFLAVYPRMLIPVPDGADSRNAAMAEMFATSLHAADSSGIKEGAALVMGGGPIGLALVKLLKIRGFEIVALSEPVEAKRTLGQMYGADAVIDPFKEDLPAICSEIQGGVGFDIAFECAGVGDNIQAAINSVRASGVVSVVSVVPTETSILPMSLNVQREVKVVGSWSSSQAENRQCLEWMAQEKLDGTALISDLVSLEDLPGVYKERIDTGWITKVLVEIGDAF